MEKEGVSTPQFKSYLMFAAALSTNVWNGASLDVIIKNGRWKDEPTLKNYAGHFVP